MSHYRSDNLKFPQVEYCLPSKGPYQPWLGEPCTIPAHVIPSDIPNPLLDSYVDQFATQPEQVMTQFLEANPNFANPRDIGRILFHTKNLSPYAVAALLFNSSYSSRALIFSFMSAIDLDCLSIVDAIKYITQKVAIPTKTIGIVHFASAFSIAYGLRNQLEWPNTKVVNDIFCASLLYCFFGGEFYQQADVFESLKRTSRSIIEQIGNDLKNSPPALYFSSVPVKCTPSESLVGEIEHEGRYRSSWKAYNYSKDGNKIICREIKDKGKEISEVGLDGVIAHQRASGKKQYCMFLQRFDNREFGKKMKDGVLKDSQRKSYTLSFKTEGEMFKWISAVNVTALIEDLKVLN
ncbi:hypothetical protein TRFO_18624 [Tritrichomonas foetus]|uniref:SEC7 domain-containing protein n=1 Tax=Tritrichomonas foetus TaxID=1144522 RepID=A0A1J4KPW3_9EUKA|nr:hypothetical protein TRFO_18624 [Tritrichomonas foetus]|eukprot:OHT11828.1 hypothetical protein TRFO_18624 [Tritrichomonas foetus]